MFKFNNLIYTFIIYFTLTGQVLASQWKFIEKYNGVDIYSYHDQKVQSSSRIYFRAKTLFKADKNRILEILLNHKLKPSWAPKLKSVKIHQQISESEYIFSEYYSVPWPFSDREFLLKGIVKKLKDGSILLIGENYSGQKFQDKDHVQCNVNLLHFKITPKGKGLSQVIFDFDGDFSGNIPKWVQRIIVKKWPAKLLVNLKAIVNNRPILKKKLPTSRKSKYP